MSFRLIHIAADLYDSRCDLITVLSESDDLGELIDYARSFVPMYSHKLTAEYLVRLSKMVDVPQCIVDSAKNELSVDPMHRPLYVYSDPIVPQVGAHRSVVELTISEPREQTFHFYEIVQVDKR